MVNSEGLPKLLIVDNNDSFTYNLGQIIMETGLVSYEVRKCKDIVLHEIQKFEKLLISPGAGVPSDYPVLKKLILEYKKEKSILGICLGHQAIAETFGLMLLNLRHVYHGIRMPVSLTADAGYLFEGIPSPFNAGLYHSWAVAKNDPTVFNVTAISQDGIIMGISHKLYDIQGVQFHPESFMTEYGVRLLSNWLKKKVASNEATFSQD